MAATGDRVTCVFLENQRIVGLDPSDPIQVSYGKQIPGEPTGFSERYHLKLDWSHGHTMAVLNGIGRIGADYFRFYGRYRTSTIDNRWPGAQIGGALGIHHGTSDLLGPRPDGPAPTVRLRNLLLGVQEAEARVFIEKALLAKKMPGDLAKKCQDLLDDRTDAIRMGPLHSRAGSAGWGGSTRRLFQYAAEVAAAK